jgi:hypothetical protein
LQKYLTYLRSRAYLNDDIIGLGKESIVAAQPSRKNGLPWFRKVFTFDKTDNVILLWLYKHTSSNKYYYLHDTTDTISADAIICNSIKFELVFSDKLLWKLLTLISFIHVLNQDTIPTLVLSISTAAFCKVFDITTLVIESITEFEEYIFSYTYKTNE